MKRFTPSIGFMALLESIPQLCILQLFLSRKGLLAKEFHRKDHLKSLATPINFQHLLQLRNSVMFVLLFSSFMRASEVLELRSYNIKLESDHLSINITKSKNDQLREGKTVVIAK